MILVKLKKYSHSTYKDEPIMSLGLHSDGLVVIVTLNHNPSFWVDRSEIHTDVSGDYILCLLQNDDFLKVKKSRS